jgi:phytoene dehydrogenase-like protein
MQCINYYEVPAGEFFRYFKETARFRVYGMAPKGNITLIESLASVIRDKGGQVWTRCRAKQILVKDGCAAGVVVEQAGEEREITAQVVVSNAGPRVTVNLAGRQHFDKGYLEEMEERLRPVPGIWISIASDEPLIDVPEFLVTEARRINIMSQETAVCPEWAPSGKHLLGAGAAFGSSILPQNIRNEIELCLQDLRENIRNFDSRAEILLVGVFRGEWPIYRSWPGYDLPQRTPIENLYNVGDGVKPPGCTGLPACAETGRIVADDIRYRLKPSGT